MTGVPQLDTLQQSEEPTRPVLAQPLQPSEQTKGATQAGSPQQSLGSGPPLQTKAHTETGSPQQTQGSTQARPPQQATGSAQFGSPHQVKGPSLAAPSHHHTKGAVQAGPSQQIKGPTKTEAQHTSAPLQTTDVVQDVKTTLNPKQKAVKGSSHSDGSRKNGHKSGSGAVHIQAWAGPNSKVSTAQLAN